MYQSSQTSSYSSTLGSDPNLLDILPPDRIQVLASVILSMSLSGLNINPDLYCWLESNGLQLLMQSSTVSLQGLPCHRARSQCVFHIANEAGKPARQPGKTLRVRPTKLVVVRAEPILTLNSITDPPCFMGAFQCFRWCDSDYKSECSSCNHLTFQIILQPISISSPDYTSIKVGPAARLSAVSLCPSPDVGLSSHGELAFICRSPYYRRSIAYTYPNCVLGPIHLFPEYSKYYWVIVACTLIRRIMVYPQQTTLDR